MIMVIAFGGGAPGAAAPATPDLTVPTIGVLAPCTGSAP